MIDSPQLLVFAGPNGSGKSTVTRMTPIIGEYINADDIKKRLQCSDIEAAQIATALREDFVRKKRDFTFETVLSTDRNINLLKEAKQMGYKIRSIFILTTDPNINVERVKIRVASGGHDVPEEKIRSRYEKSIRNLSLLLTVVDEAFVFDNSNIMPKLILEKNKRQIVYHPTKEWPLERLLKLIQ